MKRKQAPLDYETKFAGFIRACAKTKAEGISHLIIPQPQALGDAYDEKIESLWRLADSGLSLVIAGQE